ncbi:MAG: hypothetical protein KTR26_20655 [Flammeovirgaceae bacterium]|nr:hypothetical protein [Flammeovirgaceae bacterium]
MPYKTIRNALLALDNGGRFYNIFTKANDGNVSAAELAKVAGVLGDKQQMILYLEMSIINLDMDARQHVYSKLSKQLKESLEKHIPQHFVPSEAKEKAIIGSNAVITGIPQFVESKTEFTGFIMVPVSTGKAMTFIMVPIMDQYNIYKLRDHATDDEFFVAHDRSSFKFPKKTMRFGGVIKELQKEEKKKAADSPQKFLEIYYYSELGD